MINERSIKVLNSLIEINNDRIEWYNTASTETKDSDLRALFSQLIQTCEECKAQLKNEVLKLGGMPTEGITTNGMLFRIWMDVKAALTRQDPNRILNSCEDGEVSVVDAYKNVLIVSPEDIATPQRRLLHEQLHMIDNNRNKIRELRDKLIVAQGFMMPEID